MSISLDELIAGTSDSPFVRHIAFLWTVVMESCSQMNDVLMEFYCLVIET
jgi:hypothetical protein